MKPAIRGLIEAVGDSDRNVWSAAISAILDLAVEGLSLPYGFNSQHDALFLIDTLRDDLIPAVPKLIQKLSGGDEDEPHPINVIEALLNLANYSKSLPTNFISRY